MTFMKMGIAITESVLYPKAGNGSIIQGGTIALSTGQLQDVAIGLSGVLANYNMELVWFSG